MGTWNAFSKFFQIFTQCYQFFILKKTMQNYGQTGAWSCQYWILCFAVCLFLYILIFLCENLDSATAGMNLAINLVTSMLAHLLHQFTWSLPPGVKLEDVDMLESPGTVTYMQTSLQVVPNPRLPLHLYTHISQWICNIFYLFKSLGLSIFMYFYL